MGCDVMGCGYAFGFMLQCCTKALLKGCGLEHGFVLWGKPIVIGLGLGGATIPSNLRTALRLVRRFDEMVVPFGQSDMPKGRWGMGVRMCFYVVLLKWEIQ